MTWSWSTAADRIMFQVATQPSLNLAVGPEYSSKYCQWFANIIVLPMFSQLFSATANKVMKQANEKVLIH